MTLLSVEKVKKNYKAVEVLKEISFTINRGEIVALAGPNGIGKTTLLKVISDLSPIKSGCIRINGVEAKNDRVKYVSYFSCLIESPAFYENLSGYDNLKFVMKCSKVSFEKLEEVLEYIHLGKALNEKVKKYSLGMKQRLAIGMAIIQEPELLVLDEPTNGLDLDSIIEFRKLMLRLKREKNMSILISTHNVADIETLSDRVLFLKEGIIYQQLLSNEQRKKNIILTSNNIGEINEKLNELYPLPIKVQIENQTLKFEVDKNDIHTFLTCLNQLNIEYEDLDIRPYSFEEIYNKIYKLEGGIK